MNFKRAIFVLYKKKTLAIRAFDKLNHFRTASIVHLTRRSIFNLVSRFHFKTLSSTKIKI